MGIKIETELRPCLVDTDGKERKALFHIFCDDGAAVIEFEDGKCSTVAPWAVKFIDNRFNQYCFNSNK